MEKLLKSFSFADEIKFHISRNCCLTPHTKKRSVENLLYKVKNHKAKTRIEVLYGI